MDVQAYLQFIKDRRSKLRQIAGRTSGAYSLGNVENEVWITTDELSAKHGHEIDFSRDEHRELVISWTYQRLVYYCERLLRGAKSIDPSDSSDTISLSEILTYGPAEDPAVVLETVETETAKPDVPDNCGSAAAAWLKILNMCDNRMLQVADFLKISVSHSYRCYKRVLSASQTQGVLPLRLAGSKPLDPRPWRRFRFYREPVQLAFDFDEALDLCDME